MNKGGGFLVNNYNPDNNYINSDRVAARVQLLLDLPTLSTRACRWTSIRATARTSTSARPIFSIRRRRRSTPTALRIPQHRRGHTPQPALVPAERRLHLPVGLPFRSLHLQRLAAGRGDGTNGVGLELQRRLAENFELRSVTGWRDYYFNAFRDDEGTVFDVQTAAGQNLKYRQVTQEFRVTSQVSEVVDWAAGIFLIDSKNTGISNAVFGGDAGAWFASNAQYALLDADPAGRGLMEKSLNVWAPKRRAAHREPQRGDLWRSQLALR